jgi:DNA-binding transcriptional LysR family regulator
MGKNGFPKYVVPSISAALDLVRTEGLLSYVPKSMAAPAVACGELAELPVGIKAMPRARFSVATLEGVAREPGVAAFLKTLGEVGGIL